METQKQKEERIENYFTTLTQQKRPDYTLEFLIKAVNKYDYITYQLKAIIYDYNNNIINVESVYQLVSRLFIK